VSSLEIIRNSVKLTSKICLFFRKGHSSEEELDDSDEQVEDRDRVDTLRTPLCEFSGPGGHLSVVVAADWLSSMDQIITAPQCLFKNSTYN